MQSAPAILEFGLVDGANVDAKIAAQALIEWVEALNAAAKAIDPSSSVAVDLVSAEAACLRFSTILKFIEQDVLGKASAKLDEYPRIKKLIALNLLVIPGAVVAGLVTEALKPEDPVLAELKKVIASSPAVKERVESFYRIVQSEKSIQNVVVRESRDGPPILKVDRAEFAERSGMWQPQDAPVQERDGGGNWSVVVTHPVAIAKPLMWGFMRDGLPFRAKMADEAFIAGIRNGTLPIAIQEGVVMQVHVSYRERLEGQIWVPVQGTYKIDKVISPSF
ncbi:hypothetical protein [Novosphingobium sediminicola]|uniref:Uncharacterized protein n=1 Tax=Novosphingobium sediminicola TaxID=563162 RepID=A0A7W6CHW0_9SPHN|nr:hypothetical protein [Novosphingobium sediminicola]MBB3956866.1 hypothetical protein [Novosphingobium sediminicola]